ncbi:MAG TPA: GNAT family protein [Solirubrobacteraceae bacterium]|nr:GNAT family protein [Solirubrobacteraceae bacterium]
MSEILAQGGGVERPQSSRVYLRHPVLADETEFTELMRVSQAFHKPWASAPHDHERFVAYIEDSQRDNFEALLVCRSADDAIIGFFNISQIVRRLFQSAYLGYAAGRPYAGHGYMREAMQLVLAVAFIDIGLHRLEANIQPGNEPSLALARGAGFRREGFSPRYLKIGGRWRDHERWAILAEDWFTARGMR